MSNKVRIGVIGSSWWMDMLHLPILKADARVDLVVSPLRLTQMLADLCDCLAITAGSGWAQQSSNRYAFSTQP